ncbi:MAG TPA: hypothetical protein VGA69_03785 [Nitriliruptorales bacterium]
MRRARLVLVLAAAGVGVGVVVAAVVLAQRDMPGPQDPGDVAAYRIRYATEEPHTGRQSVQIVEVERPYRARSRVLDADGTTLRSGNVWTQTAAYIVDAQGVVSAVQPIPPGRPGPDVRLDVSLPEALEQGVVRRAGTDVVAGLACTQFRTLGPLDATLPQPPADDEFTVSCVDAAGRVLRDTWTVAGQVIRRRVASAVDAGVSLTDDELFGAQGPPPVPTEVALVEVRLLPQLPQPPLALHLPDELAGLALDLIVEIRDLPVQQGIARGTRLTQRATYTDGVRLLVVEQSRTLTGQEPPPPHGAPFELPPLQGAVLTISFDGLVVTGTVGDIRVEIRGALTRSQMSDLDLTGDIPVS